MQLLKIPDSITLSQLSDIVGSSNASPVLAENRLSRTPNIGSSFQSICNSVYENTSPISVERKQMILNTLTTDSDIFESTALQSEDGWKLMSTMKTLPHMLKIPDSVSLPDSPDVLGNHKVVANSIYKRAISDLQSTGQVDPSIFNTVGANVSIYNSYNIGNSQRNRADSVFQGFKIPWGQIVLWSSIEQDSRDLPVYPEELSDGRIANYTQMPDMLYQYEPWQVFQSSGTRQGTYTFKFHRDMWTGNHNDGLANDLIRFCEANCYPEYKGSVVYAPTCTLYIAGKSFISGVITQVTTNWSGPIGHDGWYLYCELELTFTEVSTEALDYYTVRNKSIIG